MHDDLAALLPDSVYHVLDASSMSMEKRAKIATVSKNNALCILLDGTCSAAFGHQYSLTLRAGDYFDASKRGLALAAAWRSGNASSGALGVFFDAVNREAHFFQYNNHWTACEPTSRQPTELSGTHVTTLWEGFTSLWEGVGLLCGSVLDVID
jgi:hypothetical protein